ncbi:hypothetical protein EGH25_04625 [Haladaptatus sp. F3-133]|uniref:Uncharacterized protein n=1 Tax=Halorutilus salinus TaxID=2487751 RepID=A0A9Q4C3X6_9EURY|nr:hypothetical protein [Halorutilus salinus]MCX2818636.1 hypothetical protein [Halorutilus salinus]
MGRLLIDTDALIAIGNTELRDTIFFNIRMDTTYVVKKELERHVKEGKASPEGSRDRYRYEGSKHALEGIEDGSLSLVNTVPKPHGKNAGEESLRIQIAQQGDEYDAVFVMDGDGRDSIRKTAEPNGYGVKTPSPAFPLYIAYDNGMVSKEEFCETNQAIIEMEGWDGYRAIGMMWKGVPIDCSAYVDPEYLP